MDSKQILFKQLSDGIIPIDQLDLWGKKAGQIDGQFTSTSESHKFWMKLLKVISKVERELNKSTHKGLVYFKIAARKLQNGDIMSRSVDYYLKAAISEDKKKYPDWHNQSAFRVQCILYAYRYYLNFLRGNTLAGVKSFLQSNSCQVGEAIGKYYDYSLSNNIPSLGLNFFINQLKIKLGERMVFVKSCYDASKLLLSDREKYKKTSSAQYGISRTIIGLCGSLIEAVLFNKRTVRNKIKKTSKKNIDNANLGNAITVYLPTIKDSELIVGLIFIWWSRNMIHSERYIHYMGKKNRLIDLNFAHFIFQITNRVLLKL